MHIMYNLVASEKLTSSNNLIKMLFKLKIGYNRYVVESNILFPYQNITNHKSLKYL